MPDDRTTGAEAVTWDLSDLYASPGDPALERDLEEADRLADGLAGEYRGKIAALTADGLAGLLRRYEALLDLAGRVGTFAYLGWSTRTGGARPRRAAAEGQRARLAAAPEAAVPGAGVGARSRGGARALMDSPPLASWRHWLEVARMYRPYLLPEGEEKVLAEKAVTGRGAWVRYFDEVESGARYELDGEPLTQSAILTRLYAPDRELRRRAAAAFTAGLRAQTHTTTFVFNTVLADKASDDRMRGYPSWIASRNLDNQVDDGTVEALVQAVTGRYDIVQRYYRLKRRLLGLDELADYDRYAPISTAGGDGAGEGGHRYPWREARERVLAAYHAFHPRMAEIATRFFEERWIDAAVRPGKRGGAFSHGAVPSVHPYVLLNYEGHARDVATLAHELGHGVHQWLARDRGVLLADTPLTTAETASVFGEMLVFQDMLAAERDPRARLDLLVRKIEDSFATVFRQVAMNRFEDAAHRARREEGELTRRALRRAVAGHAEGDVRRQPHPHPRLRPVVELHPPLPAHPRLRLRLRLRRAAGAGPAPPLPGGRAALPAALPGHAGRRRLAEAVRAGGPARRGPRRPGVLGAGAGHAGGAGDAGRGRRSAGTGGGKIVDLRAQVSILAAGAATAARRPRR